VVKSRFFHYFTENPPNFFLQWELEIFESLKMGGLKPQAIFERDKVEQMLKGAAAIWTHNIWI
jgi:hypothetical protein